MRRYVRAFPAFQEGPPEFYARAVIDFRAAPPRVEPEPTPPACRPRNFVQCMPAFEIHVLPVR